MNWNQAIIIVNDAIKRSDDQIAIEAWRVLNETTPPPYVAIPPGALGGVEGRYAELARQFLETWEKQDRRGLEILTFRLVQAAEALVEALDAGPEVVLANGRRGDATWQAGEFVMIPPTDEVYQVAYCDGCGGELLPSGCCPACQ